MSDPTINEVVDRYLNHAAATDLHCPEARSQRLATLGAFQEALGALRLSECRPFHLSDWIEEQPRLRSSSTKKARANQVNAVFNWAVATGRIAANPFARVNYPESPPRACMSDVALDELLDHANECYSRALRFLRLTGCRLSDLCRMLWQDVDCELGVVRLDKHKAMKKTGKPRVVVLTAEAVEVLEECYARNATHGVGFVFLNTRGKPWTRRTLGQQLQRLKERFGIDAATLHGIRHQVGTEAVRRGASLKMVSLVLGHASAQITERYYLHLDDEVDGLRRAAEIAAPKRTTA